MTHPSKRSPGYLGIYIMIGLSLCLGILALRQGLSAQQRYVEKAFVKALVIPPNHDHKEGEETPRLEEVPDGEEIPSWLMKRINQLGKSEISLRVLEQENSKNIPKALNKATIRLASDSEFPRAVTVQDRHWLNARYHPKTNWTGTDGSAWARTWLTPEISVIAHAPSKVAPSLPWKWIIFGGIAALLGSLLLQRRLVGSPWVGLAQLSWSAPWLITPLVSALSTQEAQGISQWSTLELGTLPTSGIRLEAASLIPLSALLPLLILSVLQRYTKGIKSAHRTAYTYMAPTLMSVGLLVFVPFALGVVLAFMRHDHGTFTWVGISHFINILFSDLYPLSHPLNFYFTLGVTVLWTALNVILHTSIGLALALLLNRKGLRLKGLYRALLIIPWAIPSYITALIWKGMFHQEYGLINHCLSLLGLTQVEWMGSFWGALSANIITNTWLGFPFMMVVSLGALQSVPSDLYEAAALAGANSWQRFRYITLPLLKPALLPAIILGSVWTFNMFNIIYLVSGGQPGGATDILITEAYRWAFEQDRYGYAAAYSILIFLILLGYASLTQRLTKSAEEVYS